MYEVFEDENGKVFETGKILFANLKLSGMNNSCTTLIRKEVKDTMMKMAKVLKRL